MHYEKEIALLKKGEIGVMPTDTIYGLVGSALIPTAVEEIYALKKRDPKKPLIVLIHDINDLALFHIHPDALKNKILQKYWPGPVSIILSCNDDSFFYLHRGEKSIAFRMPKLPWLIEFLKETGPLVAPSANTEGNPPAKNITEAKNYFGEKTSFYINMGEKTGNPSMLISLINNKEVKVR